MALNKWSPLWGCLVLFSFVSCLQTGIASEAPHPRVEYSELLPLHSGKEDLTGCFPNETKYYTDFAGYVNRLVDLDNEDQRIWLTCSTCFLGSHEIFSAVQTYLSENAEAFHMRDFQADPVPVDEWNKITREGCRNFIENYYMPYPWVFQKGQSLYQNAWKKHNNTEHDTCNEENFNTKYRLLYDTPETFDLKIKICDKLAEEGGPLEYYRKDALISGKLLGEMCFMESTFSRCNESRVHFDENWKRVSDHLKKVKLDEAKALAEKQAKVREERRQRREAERSHRDHLLAMGAEAEELRQIFEAKLIQNLQHLEMIFDQRKSETEDEATLKMLEEEYESERGQLVQEFSDIEDKLSMAYSRLKDPNAPPPPPPPEEEPPREEL